MEVIEFIRLRLGAALVLGICLKSVTIFTIYAVAARLLVPRVPSLKIKISSRCCPFMKIVRIEAEDSMCYTC